MVVNRNGGFLVGPIGHLWPVKPQATGAAICLSTAWRLDPSARRFVEEPTGVTGGCIFYM